MDLETSRNGSLTAVINGKYVHSKYDPENEAKRLVESFLSEHNPSDDSLILVLEPGLGYSLKILLSMYSRENIAVLFYSPECYEYCRSEGLTDGIKSFLFTGNQNPDSFLSALFSGRKLKDINILETPSSSQIFKNHHNRILKKIVETLKIIQGSEMTGNHFALKWFLNSLVNFKFNDFHNTIESINTPVILAASGPGLEPYLSRISELSDSYTIAALPSSLCTLKHYNIVPDLVFTTDPGYYAREHLKYLPEETIVVSSLISSLGHPGNTLCGLNQNTFTENLLLRENELTRVPEMGTVAATALHFLMNRCPQNIYIAGLDFCLDDIKMHAAPHSFTPLILQPENRLNPGYNCYYQRAVSMSSDYSGGKRFSRNMDTYTSWFRQQVFQNRVYRLAYSPVTLPIQETKNIPDRRICSDDKIKLGTPVTYPDRNERSRRLSLLSESLSGMTARYSDTGILPESLIQFTREVFPSAVLSSSGDSFSSPSAKDDFLYKMNYLVQKIYRIANE
ncbi:MAG: DUF115 domain-containing protein [Spirochaetales bacterium]|nr:DUF115 domain-containing protein [Spirochaetales bacterium]